MDPTNPTQISPQTNSNNHWMPSDYLNLVGLTGVILFGVIRLITMAMFKITAEDILVASIATGIFGFLTGRASARIGTNVNTDSANNLNVNPANKATENKDNAN